MNFDKPYKPKWTKLFRIFPGGKETFEKNPDAYEQKIVIQNLIFKTKMMQLSPEFAKKMPETTTKILATAWRFNKSKDNVKAAGSTLLILILLVATILLPVYAAFFKVNLEGFWRKILFFILHSITATIALTLLGYLTGFVKAALDRITELIKYAFGTTIIATLACLIYYFFKYDDIYSVLIFSAAAHLSLFYVGNVVVQIFKILIDIYYYKSKIRITRGLILESAFLLSDKPKNHFRVTSNTSKNLILKEVEQLASLIETDWQASIETGDEHTLKWKRDTFSGIAASIRNQKKNIIIPSEENVKIFKEKMNQVLFSVVKNDWASLITEEVPAAHVRKKSPWAIVKSLVVTFLPLISYFCIKQFCTVKVVNENYLPLFLLFSIIWTTLNVMLWLDPEIANKLSAVKTAKSLFQKGGEG